MTEETFTATFRLMQESGVQGPIRTVQVESVQHAKELAFAWSEGQLGHPWDVCTIDIPELESVIELREPGTSIFDNEWTAEEILAREG